MFIANRFVRLHFSQTIPSPFAPSHIDNEISIFFIVKEAFVTGLVGAGPWWEGVDHALGDEGDAVARPGLVGVEVFL